MPQTANRSVSRREQVIAHAITGALTDRTMARITCSTLREVRRWRRQAGIKLMDRRALATQRYRDNYRAMLVGAQPQIRREVQLHNWLNRSTPIILRVISRPSRSSNATVNNPVRIT